MTRRHLRRDHLDATFSWHFYTPIIRLRKNNVTPPHTDPRRRVSGLGRPRGYPAGSRPRGKPHQDHQVYVNSPGSDTGSNKSLNAEYVRIKNTGSTNKSLKGWTVRDESSHIYTFGTFTLQAGASVTLRSGKGTNTAATRYWQKTWYAWNNSGGDSARLRTAAGTAIDSCAWKTVASYVTC